MNIFQSSVFSMKIICKACPQMKLKYTYISTYNISHSKPHECLKFLDYKHNIRHSSISVDSFTAACMPPIALAEMNSPVNHPVCSLAV